MHSDSGSGGPGGPLAPKYFANQLTLFEPEKVDYPHLLLLAPPMIYTFRQHCHGTKLGQLGLGWLGSFGPTIECKTLDIANTF